LLFQIKSFDDSLSGKYHGKIRIVCEMEIHDNGGDVLSLFSFEKENLKRIP